MKEIQLFLRPAPGKKPEFLASVRPVDPNPAAIRIWEAVLTILSPVSRSSSSAAVVVLEDYTREGWAWKPDKTNSLTNLTVESTDGRNKLPGFVGFLKQRQKSAFGRFGPAGVWVVSYVQTSGGGGGNKQPNNPPRMDCRISTNIQSIPNCHLRQPSSVPVGANSSSRNQPQSTTPSAASASAHSRQQAPSDNKKKGGLLGKLLGAQQRTNQHVAVATGKGTVPTTTKKSSSANSTAAAAAATKLTAPDETSTKTVQEVFTEFRQFCQDTMLDFDIAPDQVLKIPILLKDHCEGLPESERPKVTMDLLKYMVYEAAEEVNDEWVAVKEPSEFMDDVVIAVYKEGAAPPEVLEDLNKGELPDEVLGQQRAVQQERARIVATSESRHKQQLEQQAHTGGGSYLEGGEDEDDDQGEHVVEALNTKKRDRRTIEDYEREKRQNAAKQGRT